MSKNLLISIILLSIISGIIIAGCGSGGTGQITVPPTVTSTTVPELVNIKGQALEVNGIPIPNVAYRDEGNGNRATVMTYNGTGWTNAGTAGFSAGSASDTSLYVYNGTPYVAYSDGGNGNRATVMTYNGTGWMNAGTAGFSASMAGYISLQVYNGKPYVAYSDLITEWIGGEEYEWAYVRVMTYNGINWMHVGTEGFSGGAGRFPSLYVYNGTPYVAYVDLSVENPLDVMMYNGTSWGAVGSFSEGKGTFPFLYLSNGTPYVVYTDMAHDYKASVMKFSN